MPTHRMIGRERARRAIPELAPSVRAVAEYYDARITHPERLTLELVADAEGDCPEAMALNYVAVEAMEGGRVVLRDTVSDERFAVSPRLVVNTAGAWADQVQTRLAAPDKLIGGTKGVHLVLRRPELAQHLGGRMLYFETFDHRACLIYPLDERHVLLGTTDVRTDDPEDVRCSDADIAYLFGVLKSVLPDAKVGPEDIVFTYGGVRPLPASGDSVTGAISRDHVLKTFEPAGDRPFPVLTLVGGKWTTYRACAAQIADAVMARLRLSRKVDTKRLPIGGGRDFPRDADGSGHLAARMAASNGTSVARAQRLVERYGAAAADFAASEHRDGGAPLETLPDYTAGEIARLALMERVEHLADIVLRRTLVAFQGGATEPAVRELAAIAGRALNWPEQRIEEEASACLALLRDRHRVPV
jgi:glycerol-3-phosphate dehydrogenase